MDGTIDIDARNGVMTLLMNRPEKKNALTDAMYGALADGMAAAEADDAIGAILLAGAGGSFTSGNDIADFAKAATGDAPKVGERGVDRFLNAQIDGAKPLVAAVEGLAVGVGATTLFQCDLVYAAETAEIRTPFTDLGLVPENASSYLAPRLMGSHRAFALLALGEPLSARAAEAAGLVNRVVPAAELMDVAFDAARRLAAKPREAMAATRALLRGDPAAIKAISLEERRIFAERLKSDEARAAFAAFMTRKR
ncbi:enoyl-CoA hydratase-related protein [Pikeienuella sp. HZG-20]|uniref:enoyl-CoA hydratase-related protein n=1 Tax=Paludibacillus litoralis TaxID=3133267 RepID=UPI0030EC11D8